MTRSLSELSDLVAEVSDIYAARNDIARDADWYLLKVQEELGELVAEYLRSTARGRHKGDDAATIRQQLEDEAEAFPPEEARRIATRLEFHYTPKHGSWLNMAEMEFSALTRQCLDRRIETAEELRAAVAAWQRTRNATRTKIEWNFRVADARKKLHWIYPS